MSLKKKIIILVGAVVLLVVSIKFFPYHCNSTLCIQNDMQKKSILLKDISINVLVAQTETEKEQGLGGVSELGPNEGMLFVFDKSDMYGFWMKNMRFPIDIVWIQNNRVIDIKKSVLPSTYPEVLHPSKPANLALELPSGFCDTHNIIVGDSLSFKP